MQQSFVALIARRLRLPYTVGLVLAGLALSLTRIDARVALTHDFVFDVILPPLLFEAAINIHWTALRRDALPVLTLAIGGTLVAAAVGGGHGRGAGLADPPRCPVRCSDRRDRLQMVIAMFKDNGVAGRLRLLVESESLFNDGVAAVLFSLALSWAQATNGDVITPAEVMKSLLFTVGGGTLGRTCLRRSGHRRGRPNLGLSGGGARSRR